MHTTNKQTTTHTENSNVKWNEKKKRFGPFDLTVYVACLDDIYFEEKKTACTISDGVSSNERKWKKKQSLPFSSRALFFFGFSSFLRFVPCLFMIAVRLHRICMKCISVLFALLEIYNKIMIFVYLPIKVSGRKQYLFSCILFSK